MLKKIISICLSLLTAISLVACTTEDELLITQSSSDITSIEQSSEETSEEPGEETSEETSEESSEETSEETSEKDTNLDTPPQEILGSGNFSTITKTNPAYDRLRQMEASSAVYNKGSTYQESELNKAKSSAQTIALGGSLISYKNASALINHYLSGTGNDFNIDVSVFMQDQTALNNRNSDINKALRACEVLAREGESITVWQVEESIFHNLSGDWKYALGSYFSSIEVQDLTCDGTTYTATLIYKVTDFYNWDENDDNAVFTGTVGYIVGDVSPKDLHQLHRAGMAKEFLSYGEISYEISWTKGQTSTQIIK